MTPTQKAILIQIEAYIRDNGISPTLRELAEMRGVSKVTIAGHVEELRKAKYLDWTPYKSRSIRLTSDGGLATENERLRKRVRELEEMTHKRER